MEKKTCPNTRALTTTTENKAGFLSVVRMRCKQWSCPVCSKQNLNKWRAHLGKLFSRKFKDTKWCFITITLPPKYHGTLDKGVSELQRTWKRLYDRLRRKFDEKISYVYMYEAHEKGTYHLHAIVSCGETYDRTSLVYVWKKPLEHHPLHRWLKDTLASINGAFIADIRRIYGRDGSTDASGAVIYALSYMAKIKSWEGFKKGARRIGHSSGIPGLPKPSKSPLKWELRQHITLNDLARHEHIEDLSLGREIGRGDFDHGFYPPANEE